MGQNVFWRTNESLIAMKAYQFISPVAWQSPLLPAVSLSCWLLCSLSQQAAHMGSFWLQRWATLSIWVDESWGICFGFSCWLISACGCTPGRDPTFGDEVLRNHTHALPDTGLDACDCIHDCKDMVLMFTLSYFSKAETSVVAVSALCGATRVDDLGKPDPFGSFFLFCYLWAPVVPRSRHPRNGHNVGGSRLWDWQLTFQSSWAMDQRLAPI